jgi:HAD superfamily hydrolase (TIGR01458 family)
VDRAATPRGLLLDIDGVLVVSWEALPGAAEALAAVRDAGIGLRLLTNTTSRTRAEIAGLLRATGLDVDPAEILTATAATADHLARVHPGARCLLLNEGGIRDDLGDVTLVGDDAAPGEVDVVVLGGAGPAFTYPALNRALACLLEGAALVAMHRNLLWRVRHGMALDTGAFLLGLERAAGVTATVVGKPAPAMFEAGCAVLGLAPGDVVMVGDDLDTDVRAAQALGITGVQVRTGKFRPGQLADGDPPDVVLQSVADLPAWLGLPSG